MKIIRKTVPPSLFKTFKICKTFSHETTYELSFFETSHVDLLFCTPPTSRRWSSRLRGHYLWLSLRVAWLSTGRPRGDWSRRPMAPPRAIWRSYHARITPTASSSPVYREAAPTAAATPSMSRAPPPAAHSSSSGRGRGPQTARRLRIRRSLGL